MAVKFSAPRPLRHSKRGALLPSIILGVSIVAASYVFAKPQNEVSTSEQKDRETRSQIVSVPVPTTNIASGTNIQDITLRLEQVRNEDLTTNVVRDVNEINGEVTLQDLPAGLPLIRTSFSRSDGSSNAVIDRIPPGMRAMTLNVDETSAVEGWASSGAIIDVLLVQNDRTSVVAERVKILSAERSVQPMQSTKGEAPTVPRTVTILVTQEQCLAISTAMAHGKIAFALRSNKDSDTWRARYYLADKLKEGGSSNSEAPKKISGLVTIGDKKFALIDGRWVPAAALPESFGAVQRTLSMKETLDEP